jgi:hypothetical protein
MVLAFVVSGNYWMRWQQPMRFTQGRKMGDSVLVGSVSVSVKNEQPVLLTGQANQRMR